MSDTAQKEVRILPLTSETVTAIGSAIHGTLQEDLKIRKTKSDIQLEQVHPEF